MEIRPSDLIQLKKDIERIRKHEEERRARKIAEAPNETVKSDSASSEKRKPRIPVSVRIREVIEAFWGPPTPSRDSVQAIPEYLITLVQVIQEEPKFRKWLLQLERMPLMHRNQQLERMSHAFRIEDGDSPIAAAFDRLHDPALFKAVCQYLGDVNGIPNSRIA